MGDEGKPPFGACPIVHRWEERDMATGHVAGKITIEDFTQ